MLLQVALDKPEHLGILPALRGVADIVEIGTPLLKRFGIAAITTAREICPDIPVMADTKTVDGGAFEANMVFGAGAAFFLSCLKDLQTLFLDCLCTDFIHVQIKRTFSFCRRCHRLVNVTHGSDNIFVHVTVTDSKVSQIICDAFIDFHCSFQVRITVRYKISFSGTAESAHAAISAAFDTDILPQVIIA